MDKYTIVQLIVNQRLKSPKKNSDSDNNTKTSIVKNDKLYEKQEKITFTSLDEDTIMFLLSQC